MTAKAAGRCERGQQDRGSGQRPAYDFVSELLATGSVSDPTFQRVKDAFGERGVVELVGAVGYYNLLSITLNVAQANHRRPHLSAPWL